MMIRLNLPPCYLEVRSRTGKLSVLDVLRQRWVRLTPEEWVRQHFLHHLVDNLGYPIGLMGHEVSLDVGQRRKRCDGLVYDRYLRPLMLLEYKSPDIQLSQRVLDQALQYNMVLRVPYLIISNGLVHYAYQINYEVQTYEPLTSLPTYISLVGEEQP